MNIPAANIPLPHWANPSPPAKSGANYRDGGRYRRVRPRRPQLSGLPATRKRSHGPAAIEAYPAGGGSFKWITILPILLGALITVHRHYDSVAREVEAPMEFDPGRPNPALVVLPVQRWWQALVAWNSGRTTTSSGSCRPDSRAGPATIAVVIPELVESR